MRDTIISVQQAADMRGVSREAINKAVRSGRLESIKLSGKCLMLSLKQVSGGKFDAAAWRRIARSYCSVPEACDIQCKTDAAVIRDLERGVVEGVRLNGKAWAVLRESAEQELEKYLQRPSSTVGRKRNLSGSRSPRVLRPTQPLQREKNKVQSQR